MFLGATIVFTAIMKQVILKHKLWNYQWVGVGWNVVAIVLVGLTALLSAPSSVVDSKYNNSLLGVILIISGAFVQSLQYVFEEKVMTMEGSASPLLLVGMEGVWGTLVCVLVLYPLAYALPGQDHGKIEDYRNTIAMIQNSPDIQNIFVLYFVSVFTFNILGALITFMLNSVWHAILENFRPISVWMTDLLIFYLITTSYGESWTKYSCLQVIGLLILLYGTAIYNAPNAGSIKLVGDFKSFFLDFSDEYQRNEVVTPIENVPALDTFLPMSPMMRRMSELKQNRHQDVEAGNNNSLEMRRTSFNK